MGTFKVFIKNGTTYKTTIKGTSLKTMKSWQRAYNRNYANGRRAAKKLGVAKVILYKKKRR